MCVCEETVVDSVKQRETWRYRDEKRWNRSFQQERFLCGVPLNVQSQYSCLARA